MFDKNFLEQNKNFLEQMMEDSEMKPVIDKMMENTIENLDEEIKKEWERAYDLRKAFLGVLVNRIPACIHDIAVCENQSPDQFKDLLVLYQLKEYVERDLNE